MASDVRTERRLDGHKLFVHSEGANVVVHAVTDGRPVTRLVFDLDADDAREIANELLGAARFAGGHPRSTHSSSFVSVERS